MGGPGQPHHSGQPGQRPGVTCADTVGGQKQAAHRHHPKQRPNIADHFFGVVGPLGFLAAPGPLTAYGDGHTRLNF